MADAVAHDWFRPKLTALLTEAEAAGIARDVSVAVVNDLINGPLFSAGPPETDERWNQDEGEPDFMVNPNAPITKESTSDNAPILSHVGHVRTNRW